MEEIISSVWVGAIGYGFTFGIITFFAVRFLDFTRKKTEVEKESEYRAIAKYLAEYLKGKK